MQKRPKEMIFMLENRKLNGSVIEVLNIRRGKHQKGRGQEAAAGLTISNIERLGLKET